MHDMADVNELFHEYNTEAVFLSTSPGCIQLFAAAKINLFHPIHHKLIKQDIQQLCS